jgi:hypothetical protein
MNPELRLWMLIGGAIIGYIVLMLANPIRASLRDGFRCLHRYPALWLTLAVFGVNYALFKLSTRFIEMGPFSEGGQPILQWSWGWSFPSYAGTEVVRGAVLPTSESVAGIFNNVITTFPFSAIAALLLLINWQGHYGVLNRALRRDYKCWGWPIFAIISLGAVAALAKPFLLYAGLPKLGATIPGRVLLPLFSVIDWLSFLFEYLFGVCIQVCLILLVYAWVRGVSFSYRHLLDFAIRRFAAVMKWAAVVLILSTLLIHLPLILSNVPLFSPLLTPTSVFAYVDRVARPLLALILILFSAVQITLTFHRESLRHALWDQWNFIHKNGFALFWFLLIAWVHFYAFNVLDRTLLVGLGEGTALGIAWQLIAPFPAALIAGWLLATWVCIYKRADTHHSQNDNWVAF